MKKLIAAELAAILLAPLPAAATCAYYGPTGNVAGSELPLPHWEKTIQLMHETGEQVSAADEALFARILTDAKLCQQDKISFQEFQARIDEAYAEFN
jgi:hypothetical protein